MSYYLVFNYDVTDPEMLGQYQQKAGQIPPEKFGIKLLVYDHEPKDIEGKSGQMMVILESEAEAMAFYNSPEYQAIVDLRVNASKGWVRSVPQFVVPTGE
jgi:uncharacterized protein (DUF1330 family)